MRFELEASHAASPRALRRLYAVAYPTSTGGYHVLVAHQLYGVTETDLAAPSATPAGGWGDAAQGRSPGSRITGGGPSSPEVLTTVRVTALVAAASPLTVAGTAAAHVRLR